MPGAITIVGLGPGDRSLRTVGAQRLLDRASRIILRTAIHPGLDDLVGDPRVTTSDDLYESGATFDEVYAGIVERVLAAAAVGDVLYAVPGHPWFGERTVPAIQERATQIGVVCVVECGVSALDVVATTLGRDFLARQVQLVDATELARRVEAEPFGGSSLDLDPSRPMLVTQIYSVEIASAVKLALGRVLPDDHGVTLVQAAGIAGLERVIDCRLHEVDRHAADHLTSLWVPPQAVLAATRSAGALHRIAARLRAPNGCPWDQKQTHASLREAVVEEAYEVVDAIDGGDPDELAEELGDLLLQVSLHAQIAEEAGAFIAEDVYDHVNRKLVRRHPHVFGDVEARDPEAVIRTWQAVKAEEKRLRPAAEPEPDLYGGLPRSMPILTRVARLLGGTRSPATSIAETAGSPLLAAVADLVERGLDPEVELDRAFRALRASTRE